ncbi:hypothetical protein QFC21_004417 [Naganishia friedmannii]|uniref:Uncharacterized protein n=1 Tax=Naganishia friedmannii TaxID=89922 RepID=A0ACC2VHA0_9TREE|nr:hypothetical protein QFC21_004417 [Naganishia friedmannii]
MPYNTSAPATSPSDNIDMNVTADDPIRPSSPDHTMVNKSSNNGDGYHAPGTLPKAGIPLITVQPLKKQEMQPSYAQDLGVNSIEHGVYGSFINTLGGCLGLLGAVPCCPSVDPGLVNVNVCTETLRVVDVKIQLSTVPRQMVMTKDNVDIDSVICWHVVSPYRAAYGINNVSNALVERAQTTLRQVVGSRLLQTIVVDREGLAAEIQDIMEATAERWGVVIESILLKDITFSPELQNLLSSAATQKRIGESKVISARAEVDAAKLMRQAADILASPAAMQIRQLDALQNMAKNAGSKVVFVPMNLSSMGSAGMSDAGRQEVQNQITASVHPDAEQARAYAMANQGQVGYLANDSAVAGPSGTSGQTMDLAPQVHNAGTYNSIERV